MNKHVISTIALRVMALMLLAPAVAAAQAPSATIPLPATQYKLTRLAPGQGSGQAVFSVDTANIVTVQIISDDEALVTSILGPSGQLIDPTNVATFGGTFNTVPGGPADSPLLLNRPSAGFQFVYAFPSLGTGNYTARFSTALTDELAVTVELMTDSQLGAALIATEPTLVLGNPAVLTAAIFDGANPVAGANVAVTVVPASGPPITLTLHDDGATGDDRAGDGLYSGEFTPAVTGNFLASAVMTGAGAGGAPFTRHGATTFTVVPRPAVLAGAFEDNGVDDNGDGLFDRVSILVKTAITTSGHYRAFVHLSTATGQTLVRSGEADLGSGSPGITVDFEADAFLQLGENGPYNVDLLELLLVDAGGATTVDSTANAGPTRAYQLSQFQRPLLALTGVTSDQGFDDNGNGQFDRLVVTLQADVVRAGFYQWGFKLTDGAGREIDFGSGFGFFNTGLNDLAVTFDGSKIGAFGANGPYQLRDLLVQGAGASLVVVDAGRTQPYLVSQFEGGVVLDTTPPVISSVAASPNVLWPPNHQMVPVSITATAVDAIDPNPVCAIASVASSEAPDLNGSGNTSTDWSQTGGLTLELRAERAGNGPGRVYTVTVQCTDGSGNSSTATVDVTVPHNQ